MSTQDTILAELRELRVAFAEHATQDTERFAALEKALTRVSVRTNTLWAVAGALLYLLAQRLFEAVPALSAYLPLG